MRFTYWREDVVASGGRGQCQWQHMVLGTLPGVAIAPSLILAIAHYQ